MTTTNLLTEEQLAEIDMRARIATPPPWLVHHDPRKYVLMPFSSEEDVLRDRDANAAFCANAREDVPRLVAEIRRLQATLDGDPHQTSAPEQRHAWRRSAIRYADKVEAELATTLNYLDTIIAAYQQDGIGPLINAVRAAKEWRGVVTLTLDIQKE